MRLIDADKLKEYMNSVFLTNGNKRLFCQIIDNAPTVEITEEQAIDKLHETGWIIRHDKEMTERPHGEWIVDEDYERFNFKKCSVCNQYAEWLDGGSQFLSNYCPNCGADMRPTETLSETAGKVADDCLNRIMGGGI